MTQNSGRDAPRAPPHHRSANPVRKSECVFSTANGLLPPSEVIPLPPIRHKERVPRKHSEVAATFNRLYVTQTHDKGVSPPGRGSAAAGSVSPKRDTCRKPYVEPKPPHTVIKGEQVDSLVKRLAQIPKRLIYAASTPHQPTHASTVVLGPIGDQEPPEYDAKRDAHLCIYWARRELLLQQERRRRDRTNSRGGGGQSSKRGSSENYNRAPLPDSDGPKSEGEGAQAADQNKSSPQRTDNGDNTPGESPRDTRTEKEEERSREEGREAKRATSPSREQASQPESEEAADAPKPKPETSESEPQSQGASDPALHNEPESTPQKSGEAEDNSAPSPAYSSEYEEPSPSSP
jgi:hypothetical protein